MLVVPKFELDFLSVEHVETLVAAYHDLRMIFSVSHSNTSHCKSFNGQFLSQLGCNFHTVQSVVVSVLGQKKRTLYFFTVPTTNQNQIAADRKTTQVTSRNLQLCVYDHPLLLITFKTEHFNSIQKEVSLVLINYVPTEAVQPFRCKHT